MAARSPWDTPSAAAARVLSCISVMCWRRNRRGAVWPPSASAAVRAARCCWRGPDGTAATAALAGGEGFGQSLLVLSRPAGRHGECPLGGGLARIRGGPGSGDRGTPRGACHRLGQGERLHLRGGCQRIQFDRKQRTGAGDD